jgi:hypothetical protein
VQSKRTEEGLRRTKSISLGLLSETINQTLKEAIHRNIWHASVFCMAPFFNVYLVRLRRCKFHGVNYVT